MAAVVAVNRAGAEDVRPVRVETPPEMAGERVEP